MSTPLPSPGPDTGTTEHRYPPRPLVRDYLMAGVGLAIALLPFIFARPGQTATVVLGVFGGLAGFLGLRTARRQAARYRLSGEQFAWGRHGLAWRDIAGVRLRHFTTRRAEPGSGWMELRLTGPGSRVTIDSELDGFLAVARAAHGAACARGITFDSATEDNFRALGLEASDPAPD